MIHVQRVDKLALVSVAGGTKGGREGGRRGREVGGRKERPNHLFYHDAVADTVVTSRDRGGDRDGRG